MAENIGLVEWNGCVWSRMWNVSQKATIKQNTDNNNQQQQQQRQKIAQEKKNPTRTNFVDTEEVKEKNHWNENKTKTDNDKMQGNNNNEAKNEKKNGKKIGIIFARAYVCVCIINISDNNTANSKPKKK